MDSMERENDQKTEGSDMRFIIKLLLAGTAAVSAAGILFGFVRYDGDKITITDRIGKEWDVTQAASLGFKPEKFQYGIGMHAFTTLDDSHLKPDGEMLSGSHRVIGVDVDDEAHAYSVRRLTYHEIANTHIAGKPIAAGF